MTFDFAAIPAVVSAGILFAAGAWAQRRVESRICRWLVLSLGIAAAIPGTLILLYYTHLFNTPAWFYAFRTAPYTEVTICGLGWIVGYCCSLIDPQGTGEKAVWPLGLIVLTSIPFIKPILDPIDLNSLRSSCPNNVCMQTTYSTCGPSSAASILLALGQDASEQSLAREALTSKGGTELWHLARALRHRGFATGYSVESSVPTLFPAPAVAGVVLRGGAGHFIALVSRTGGQLTVVDPLKGKFTVSDDELRTRYQFSGVFLLVCPKP